MTTWSLRTFTRALAALRTFAEAEPESTTRARADFPEAWDAEHSAWMGAFLAAWLMHGREDAEGRTAAGRRLQTEGGRLPRAERAILAALDASWCSLFEVEQVRLGEGLQLRDVLLDEVLDVREQNLTVQVAPQDLVVLWVIPVEGHLELVGGGVLVSHRAREHLITASRRELAAQPGAMDRHRRVRRLAPFLCRRVMELFDPAPPPMPPPRRRAFQDAAGRKPRRQAEAGLAPGSAYVVKLGPIDLGPKERASLYIALAADGAPLARHVGRKDAEGLQALAGELKGHTLYCEGRLARAGAASGYVARPMPADIARLRAVLAVLVYWGPESMSGLPPEVVVALLDASADLIRAAPWEHWTNEEVFPVHLEGSVSGTRELSVLGNGGQELGLGLFDRAGSVERLSLSAPPGPGGEVLIPDSLGLTLDDEPSWVVKAVQQVTGLPFAPSVMRVLGNTPRLETAEDVVTAAAVARALARARPEERKSEVELRVGDLHVRARLEIPLPLLSGRYVGKAPLTAPLVPRPVPSGRPRREVPTRKVSETLLEFAQPVLEEAGYLDDPQDELFLILALALCAWNAVVQDTWEPEKGWVERARASLRRLPADDREQMTRDFELLVERKHRHFAEDPRLFDRLEVTTRVPGDLNVRLMGAVAPGARAEFVGG
jgi:hypothetical protein